MNGERCEGGGRALPGLEAVGGAVDGEQGKVPVVTGLFNKEAVNE